MAKSIDVGITICYPLGMKTAISIPDELFQEIDKYAKEQDYSRSEVFAAALREFLERMKSRQLLDALNEVYAETESVEDTQLREKAKKRYAQQVLKKY